MAKLEVIERHAHSVIAEFTQRRIGQDIAQRTKGV